MGVSIHGGYPQNGWFRGTPISGNHNILGLTYKKAGGKWLNLSTWGLPAPATDGQLGHLHGDATCSRHRSCRHSCQQGLWIKNEMRSYQIKHDQDRSQLGVSSWSWLGIRPSWTLKIDRGPTSHPKCALSPIQGQSKILNLLETTIQNTFLRVGHQADCKFDQSQCHLLCRAIPKIRATRMCVCVCVWSAHGKQSTWKEKIQRKETCLPVNHQQGTSMKQMSWKWSTDPLERFWFVVTLHCCVRECDLPWFHSFHQLLVCNTGIPWGCWLIWSHGWHIDMGCIIHRPIGHDTGMIQSPYTLHRTSRTSHPMISDVARVRAVFWPYFPRRNPNYSTQKKSAEVSVKEHKSYWGDFQKNPKDLK